MKYEITKQTTELIDIELPVFSKAGSQYFGLLTNGKRVAVSMWSSGPVVYIDIPNKTEVSLALASERITEEEFQSVFNDAINLLQKAFAVAVAA